MKKSARMLLIAAAVTVPFACSSTKAVPKSDIETGAAEKLEAQLGQKPEISCADDLVAEVGETIRCELTADDGSTIGATVTATDVDGDDVQYEIVVDDE